MSYSKNEIRERIQLYLINHDRNEKLLKEVPYREFLDLAVVYRLLTIDEEGENLETISRQQLDELGMTEEELYQAAMENMKSDVKILTFGNVNNVINVKNGLSAICLVDSIACVSNSETYKGSGMMLNKELMSAFAEHFESDVLILPSSIHELMVVMYTGDIEQIKYLKQTVEYVNRTPDLLSPNDFLSDNVYFFSRKTQEITIA